MEKEKDNYHFFPVKSALNRKSVKVTVHAYHYLTSVIPGVERYYLKNEYRISNKE